MMRITLKAVGMVSLLVAAVLILNTLVGAQEPDKQTKTKPTSTASMPSTLSESDKKFVMEIAHGGMMEVELGRLATEKAANADVKAFGQRMVDDHSKANDELMALASSKGVMIAKPGDQSTMPDNAHAKMMKEHDKVVSKLSALSGADFDREYMKMMVDDHTKDVAEFEKEAARASDPDIKAWAAKTLPTLKEHLQQARDTYAKVGGKTK